MGKLATLIAEVIKKIGLIKGANSQKFTVFVASAGAALYWASESVKMALPNSVVITGTVGVLALAAWYIYCQAMIDKEKAKNEAAPPPINAAPKYTLPAAKSKPRTKAKR